MLKFFIAFFCVFFITILLTPLIKKIGLVDKPTARKQHDGEVPLIGGLAIFVSCAIAALYFVPSSSEMFYLLVASGLLVVTGSIDDRFDLHYQIRLGVQALAAALLIWGSHAQLYSLGNLFGLGDIKPFILSVPITLIAVIGMINAYNMIDGIDGLSGGLSLISTIGLVYLLGNKISDGATSILTLMSGALSAYLILNLHILPKWTNKIFMGDAGSMVLGFVITAFLIRYSQGSKQVMMPVTALWIAAVPLMDILVTCIRRVRHGKSPFHPDRTHIHHIFLRAGFKKTTTLIIILMLQLVTVALGVMLERHGSSTLSFSAFILVFILYLQVIKHSFKTAKFIRKAKSKY